MVKKFLHKLKYGVYGDIINRIGFTIRYIMRHCISGVENNPIVVNIF